MSDTSDKMIQRIRIECVSGPYHDGTRCVRYADVTQSDNLWDLNELIQDSVQFDCEHAFYYFTAEDETSERSILPPEVDVDCIPVEGEGCVDDDVYEDIRILDVVPKSGSDERLFYVSICGRDVADWVFEISLEGKPFEAFPGLTYPYAADENAEGPNPLQYGLAYGEGMIGGN